MGPDGTLVVGMLERPRQLVRHVHRPAAEAEHGRRVGSQRVADHAEALGGDGVPAKDALVRRSVLLGDDLDTVDEVAESGAGDLRLLVEEVALRDEKHGQPGTGRRLHRGRRARQQLDRVGEQLLAEVEQRRTSGIVRASPARSIAVSTSESVNAFAP